MTATADIIKRPLGRDRSNVFRGFTGSVDRTGGDRGAGLIAGFSVITLGEALGHGLWCDQVFLEQIHAAIQDAGETGLKCRFTHPGLSADGMGKFLGVIKNSTLMEGQVFADLHLSKSAHKAPDGDLAEYVMELAEENAEHFGSSIVFEHDAKAEKIFHLEHQNEETGDFESPDPNNTQHLAHCRLKKLRGADLVDSPAANPGGLFHSGQEIAQEATELMEYTLDLDGAKPPALAQFDVDPDRLKLFFNRFLADHNLELVPIEKEHEMTKDTPSTDDNQPAAPAAPEAPQQDDGKFRAELNRYVQRFGAENGAAWFTEGKSYEAAQDAHIELLADQLQAAGETITDLEAKLGAIDQGEETPFEGGNGEAPEKPSFKNCFRMPSRN